MRKQILARTDEPMRSKQHTAAQEDDWLNLEQLASVEVSSEDSEFPIENALVPGAGAGGWRASAPGPQTILIRFDLPQRVRQIVLSFVEPEHERQQEFSVCWTAEGGQTGEIVRQQWTFAPGGSTEEQETYTVDLPALHTLSIEIDPDRGRSRYPATLAALRLA
jgi:hypothetical protein